MEAEGHVQLLADGPYRVVLGARHVGHVAQVHGHRGEDHAAVAHVHGPPDLRHGGLGRPDGDDALWDEAVACRGPLLDQPVVVGLHAGDLELRVLEPPEGLSGHPCDGGEENRIADARSIHDLEPFRRLVRRRRDLVPSGRFDVAVGHQGTSPGGMPVEEHLPVDHPPFRALGAPLQVWNAVAPPFLGEPGGPEVRRLLDVVVRADQRVSRRQRDLPGDGPLCGNRLLDLVYPEGVLVEQFPAVVLRHSVEHPLDRLP